MEIKSTTRYARFSPKKGRDVAREIVGLSVSDAIDTLTFTPKKAAFLINKTLKTAVADAENNFDLDAENLIVKEATVTAGPAFRRFKPRARGSASAIKKRTSHITVTVVQGDLAPGAAPKKAAPKSATTNTAAEAAPVEFTASAEAPEQKDDLKKITGVGPVLETKLNEKGVYTFDQILAWTPEEISELDEALSLKGRIERDNWIDQAKQLKEEAN